MGSCFVQGVLPALCSTGTPACALRCCRSSHWRFFSRTPTKFVIPSGVRAARDPSSIPRPCPTLCGFSKRGALFLLGYAPKFKALHRTWRPSHDPWTRRRREELPRTPHPLQAPQRVGRPRQVDSPYLRLIVVISITPMVRSKTKAPKSVSPALSKTSGKRILLKSSTNQNQFVSMPSSLATTGESPTLAINAPDPCSSSVSLRCSSCSLVGFASCTRLYQSQLFASDEYCGQKQTAFEYSTIQLLIAL